MDNYCEHDDCRAHHRANLGIIDGALQSFPRQCGKTSLLERVRKINEGQVRCVRPFQERADGKAEA